MAESSGGGAGVVLAQCAGCHLGKPASTLSARRVCPDCQTRGIASRRDFCDYAHRVQEAHRQLLAKQQAAQQKAAAEAAAAKQHQAAQALATQHAAAIVQQYASAPMAAIGAVPFPEMGSPTAVSRKHALEVANEPYVTPPPRLNNLTNNHIMDDPPLSRGNNGNNSSGNSGGGNSAKRRKSMVTEQPSLVSLASAPPSSTYLPTSAEYDFPDVAPGTPRTMAALGFAPLPTASVAAVAMANQAAAAMAASAAAAATATAARAPPLSRQPTFIGAPSSSMPPPSPSVNHHQSSIAAAIQEIVATPGGSDAIVDITALSPAMTSHASLFNMTDLNTSTASSIPTSGTGITATNASTNNGVPMTPMPPMTPLSPASIEGPASPAFPLFDQDYPISPSAPNYVPQSSPPRPSPPISVPVQQQQQQQATTVLAPPPARAPPNSEMAQYGALPPMGDDPIILSSSTASSSTSTSAAFPPSMINGIPASLSSSSATTIVNVVQYHPPPPRSVSPSSQGSVSSTSSSVGYTSSSGGGGGSGYQHIVGGVVLGPTAHTINSSSANAQANPSNNSGTASAAVGVPHHDTQWYISTPRAVPVPQRRHVLGADTSGIVSPSHGNTITTSGPTVGTGRIGYVYIAQDGKDQRYTVGYSKHSAARFMNHRRNGPTAALRWYSLRCNDARHASHLVHHQLDWFEAHRPDLVELVAGTRVWFHIRPKGGQTPVAFLASLIRNATEQFGVDHTTKEMDIGETNELITDTHWQQRRAARRAQLVGTSAPIVAL